ncbi:MAG: diaminopimelate decarboxylase [Clostridiales bacterium]|nr:diaminopimelate decarboxylase [Clostridiales bacterium]
MNYYTKETNFYGNLSPEKLIERYGSPLYVYNESILRERCKELTSFVSYPDFKVNYSCKANSNLSLLKIIHQEGLHADAISPGEVHVLLKAGFKPKEILYISNNISKEEMEYVIAHGILLSVDSLSQLEQYGRLNPGGNIAIRLNPGFGIGHHKNVITAGENTKFGIGLENIPHIKQIAKKFNLKIMGLNQHLGSLFMKGDIFIEGANLLLKVADSFPHLDFVDIGGGFGIPYQKQDNEPRLELIEFGNKLSEMLTKWAQDYGKNVKVMIEPGRYIVAECGVLLGSVHNIKQNHSTRYIGTDLGFNVLARPMLYDSHHDIEIYKNPPSCKFDPHEKVTVVGNICESGDIIAKERLLPKVDEGDIIGIMDAGAYGYSMSSNYNNRLRPAEILIDLEGKDRLIRRRETLEDLMNCFN